LPVSKRFKEVGISYDMKDQFRIPDPENGAKSIVGLKSASQLLDLFSPVNQIEG
jgi:hypothetical protein